MTLKEFVIIALVNEATRPNPSLGFRENKRYVSEIARIIAGGVRKIIVDALGAHSRPWSDVDGVRYGTLKRIRGLVLDFVYEWMDEQMSHSAYNYYCRNIIAAALADGCADASEKDVFEIVEKFVEKYTN